MPTGTRFVLNKVVLAFPRLLTAEIPKFKKDKSDAKPVRSVTLLVPLDQIEALRKQVAEKTFGDVASVPKGFPKALGVHDGDALDEDDERRFPQAFSGYAVLKASTQFDLAPLWYGPNKRAPTESELYSGLIANVSVTPNSWTYENKRGVSFYLNGLWITGKGTKLSLNSGDASDDLGGSGPDFGEGWSDDEGSELI